MSFNQVIFAGGGSRCFWQLGFCAATKMIGQDVLASAGFVGATSAGCAMATAALLGREEEALAAFMKCADGNEKNFYWQRLNPLDGRSPWPHEGMYRAALEAFIGQDDLNDLKQYDFQCLMAQYPLLLGPRVSALLGFGLYELEKRVCNPLHPSWTRAIGFRPLVGCVKQCTQVAGLVDLILASSSVPPVLPSGRYAGLSVLDGGLIDNVPLLLAQGRPGCTLVLLSRHYSQPLPATAELQYVCPSQPVPVHKFDYANPQRLQQTFDLGFKDALDFMREWELGDRQLA